MQFPHPIRTVRNTVKAIQLTILNFQKLLLALRLSVENNTAATAAQLETAKATLATATATQTAVAYLERSERQRRQSQGQPHEL